MNEPYRLRYTNQIVGTFLLVLLLFVIILSLLLLRAGDYFVAKDDYWVEIAQEDIDHLHRGAAVMMLGENVGKVESIHYIDGSDVIRVNLSIDPSMSSEIFEDSVLLLERRYGLGAPILVVHRGSLERGKTPLPPGSQIKNFQGEADRVDQMAGEVETVSESIQSIQRRIAAVADRFEGSLEGSFDPAFDNISRASNSFNESNETLRPDILNTTQTIRDATSTLETRIDRLSDNIEQLLEKDVRTTLADVRESSDDISDAANSVNQTSEEVNADVAESLEKMREAIEQVRALAQEARDVVRIVRSEANDLPGTAERFNDTVDDTQDLVGEVRSHWLLRRYSTKPGPTQPVSPSAVRGGSIR